MILLRLSRVCVSFSTANLLVFVKSQNLISYGFVWFQ